jgi:hypothetical protein
LITLRQDERHLQRQRDLQTKAEIAELTRAALD